MFSRSFWRLRGKFCSYLYFCFCSKHVKSTVQSWSSHEFVVNAEFWLVNYNVITTRLTLSCIISLLRLIRIPILIVNVLLWSLLFRRDTHIRQNVCLSSVALLIDSIKDRRFYLIYLHNFRHFDPSADVYGGVNQFWV